LKQNHKMKLKATFLCLIFAKTILSFAQPTAAIEQAGSDRFIGYILEFQNEIIIDVRDTASYENRKIHGAILAPASDQLSKIVDTLDFDTPLLVYCSRGKRSQKACEELISKGFRVVINLKEGLNKWPEKQYPLDKIYYK
jgi:rhodanese-related sulfurtransferase